MISEGFLEGRAEEPKSPTDVGSACRTLFTISEPMLSEPFARLGRHNSSRNRSTDGRGKFVNRSGARGELCAPQEESGCPAGDEKFWQPSCISWRPRPWFAPRSRPLSRRPQTEIRPASWSGDTMAQALFGLGHDAISLPTSSWTLAPRTGSGAQSANAVLKLIASPQSACRRSRMPCIPGARADRLPIRHAVEPQFRAAVAIGRGTEVVPTSLSRRN